MKVTLDNLREETAKQIGCKPSQIVDDAEFVEDLGADALDLLDLVCRLERDNGITILDGDVEGLRTYGDFRRLIERKLGATST